MIGLMRSHRPIMCLRWRTISYMYLLYRLHSQTKLWHNDADDDYVSNCI